MALFYCEEISDESFQLSVAESKHCIKVLRHKKGDLIQVIDGLGQWKEGQITQDNSSKVICKTINSKHFTRQKSHYIHVALSPTKNMDRIEWFVEKACELDIDEISFIFCKHSERKILKIERLHKKAISALKQSGGYHKTIINEPIALNELFEKSLPIEKLIAHVDKENPVSIKSFCQPNKDYLILVGPEGDFSEKEIELSKDAGFQKVSLGKKVLRTETAGVIACHSLNFINDY